MVAPNAQFLNVSHCFACFGRNLAGRAVVVKAQHGCEVFARKVWSALHGNVGIGIGRVAHHQHTHVTAGHSVERLALTNENLPIDREQFSTLHTRLAGHGTYQQRVVGIFERGHGVAMGFHTCQQRKSTVFQFHHHALERLLWALCWHLKQLKNDGLIFTQHFA